MLLDHYECVNSTLHFGIVIFVNTLCALLHSKYFIQKYSGWSVLKGQHPVKYSSLNTGPSKRITGQKVTYFCLYLSVMKSTCVSSCCAFGNGCMHISNCAISHINHCSGSVCTNSCSILPDYYVSDGLSTCFSNNLFPCFFCHQCFMDLSPKFLMACLSLQTFRIHWCHGYKEPEWARQSAQGRCDLFNHPAHFNCLWSLTGCSGSR